MQQPIEAFRLSPQQQQLAFLQHGDPCSPYRAQSALLIEGPLQVMRLRAALDQIVARHEILHTFFRQPEGMSRPFQVVGQASVAWDEIVDLSDLPDRVQTARIDKALQE